MRIWIIFGSPFGMPLHRKQGRAIWPGAIGFDKAIGRACFNIQAICELTNALIVDRVHVQPALGIGAGQHAAIGKINGMAVVKHRIEGNVIRRMVTDEVITGAGVAALCTALSDVDFLKAAANT